MIFMIYWSFFSLLFLSNIYLTVPFVEENLIISQSYGKYSSLLIQTNSFHVIRSINASLITTTSNKSLDSKCSRSMLPYNKTVKSILRVFQNITWHLESSMFCGNDITLWSNFDVIGWGVPVDCGLVSGAYIHSSQVICGIHGNGVQEGGSCYKLKSWFTLENIDIPSWDKLGVFDWVLIKSRRTCVISDHL